MGRIFPVLTLIAALLAPLHGHGARAASDTGAASYTADAVFTLKTVIAEGRMVFVGAGGDIDGRVNPDLQVQPGQVVQINLVNGDGATHDIAFPALDLTSERITRPGASTTLAFRVTKPGELVYICTLPGHRAAGMEGRLIVGAPPSAAPRAEAADVVRAPTDLPPPAAVEGPRQHRLELEAVEITGQLADGARYRYWTFNGTVPGPFLRVRAGDTVEITLANRQESTNVHSIDLHAVTGPGGGAELTQVAPGHSATFTFKALSPGLYVYHCATPMVAHHIANGMYGLILVESKQGLPPVDREFYVMQGEIYAEGDGPLKEFSLDHLLREEPEYYVFNGAVGALTDAHPLRARVGERVRIYFGVGGPNATSSFHVIGEIFDRVYAWGDLTTPAAREVQTITVPAGGSVVVEFTLEVPGRYILVDHALSRLERGLVGYLFVEGPDDPDVFRNGPAR